MVSMFKKNISVSALNTKPCLCKQQNCDFSHRLFTDHKKDVNLAVTKKIISRDYHFYKISFWLTSYYSDILSCSSNHNISIYGKKVNWKTKKIKFANFKRIFLFKNSYGVVFSSIIFFLPKIKQWWHQYFHQDNRSHVFYFICRKIFRIINRAKFLQYSIYLYGYDKTNAFY